VTRCKSQPHTRVYLSLNKVLSATDIDVDIDDHARELGRTTPMTTTTRGGRHSNASKSRDVERDGDDVARVDVTRARRRRTSTDASEDASASEDVDASDDQGAAKF